MDLPALKDRIRAEVEARADLLVDASHQIHAHPELNYDEHFAHDLLTTMLAGEGLAVERGAFDLDTAFVARAGSSGPVIAVLCEYDALPGIDHARPGRVLLRRVLVEDDLHLRRPLGDVHLEQVHLV